MLTWFSAILFTIIFSCLLSLINIGSTVAFNQIVSLGVVALLSSYIISISCIALRRLRRQSLLASEFSLGRWGIAINLLSLAYLLLVWVMSFFPPLANPALSSMNWSVVVYSGVLFIAVFYYIFWARHHYVGPVKYVKKAV